MPYRRTNQQPQSREDILEKQIKKNRRRIVLLQGPGPYKRGRETYKRLTRTIAKEKKEPK